MILRESSTRYPLDSKKKAHPCDLHTHTKKINRSGHEIGLKKEKKKKKNTYGVPDDLHMYDGLGLHMTIHYGVTVHVFLKRKKPLLLIQT